MDKARLWFQLEKLVVTTLVATPCVVGFLLVEHRIVAYTAAGGSYVQLETWLDQYIPFVPIFAYPYYLYYLWVLLSVPAVRQRGEFYHAVAAISLVQIVAMVTYAAFPSFMQRPEVVGNGLGTDLVRKIYQIDPGFNVMPSLHVGHSTLVALLYRSYHRRWYPLIATGTALICASTVLIKQHYVIDLPAGFALAIAAFYVTVPVRRLVERRALARGARQATTTPATSC
ncbi:MAG: phosphatase PAP2 family protein [Polyangiaceae bacterium]|nr:phosphatase PAP2 family protein [Polyangiaceae bacterium]